MATSSETSEIRPAILRVSNSTVRIYVARGDEGEWAGWPSPLSCGQLTRCLSAVAKRLVLL